jgi:hypothetical protein
MLEITLTPKQYGELLSRLKSVKDAVADLQTALNDIDYMNDLLEGKLLKSVGANEWAERLDVALSDLVEDINAQTGEEFTVR